MNSQNKDRQKRELLKAINTIENFIEYDCSDQMGSQITTPDGIVRPCDWGYVYDGLHELRSYAMGLQE